MFPHVKGVPTMKKQLIAEITQILNALNENQLLYILTFIKKLFGSH